MANSLWEQVWQRAEEICEYCRMPQLYDPMPFQVDHIIAQQHHGPTVFENLALACLSCNNHKGPNIAGIDREGGRDEVVRLFHPRNDLWDEHFEWDGPFLRGLTPIGPLNSVCVGNQFASPRRIARIPNR